MIHDWGKKGHKILTVLLRLLFCNFADDFDPELVIFNKWSNIVVIPLLDQDPKLLIWIQQIIPDPYTYITMYFIFQMESWRAGEHRRSWEESSRAKGVLPGVHLRILYTPTSLWNLLGAVGWNKVHLERQENRKTGGILHNPGGRGLSAEDHLHPKGLDLSCVPRISLCVIFSFLKSLYSCQKEGLLKKS